MYTLERIKSLSADELTKWVLGVKWCKAVMLSGKKFSLIDPCDLVQEAAVSVLLNRERSYTKKCPILYLARRAAKAMSKFIQRMGHSVPGPKNHTPDYRWPEHWVHGPKVQGRKEPNIFDTLEAKPPGLDADPFDIPECEHLRSHFYGLESRSEVADALGISKSLVTKRRKKVLEKLRANPEVQEAASRIGL